MRLLRAGHQVTAIVRDPEKAEASQRARRHGSLAALDTPKRYMEAVLESDAVMHTALEDSPRGVANDRQFLDQVLPAISETGSAKTFIYTSGVWVLGPTPEPVDESAPLDPTEISAWRCRTSSSCSTPAP